MNIPETQNLFMSPTKNSDKNKRIAKNTGMLYLRMFLIMGVTLYTSRIVLQTLGVTDYGIYNVVGGVVAMFGFLNGALTAATQRFLAFEIGQNNDKKLCQVFSLSLMTHAGLALIIFLLAESIGLWLLYYKMQIPIERFDAALWVFHFAVMSSIVLIMSVPYNAVIVAYERMSAFAYISVVEVVLKLFIVYLLQLSDFDKLKFYAILMFGVQLFIRLLYGAYCSRHFKYLKFRLLWDKPLFKEITNFIGWSVYGSITYLLYTQGLNVLLNIFFGPIVNAARGIVVQIQSAIMSFSTNFQMALNPQITKSYAENDLNRMHTLILAGSKYSFFLLYLFSLPLFIEAEFVLKLWLGQVPEYTVDFLRFILCISIIDVMANPLVVSVQATSRVRKYQFIVGNVLLAIVVGAYLFMKIGCSPQDVFLLQLIMITLLLIIRFRLTRKLINMSTSDYILKVIYRITAVVLLSCPLPILLYVCWTGSTILRFMSVCTASLFMVSVTCYFVGINANERRLFTDYMYKVKNKIIRIKRE